MTKLVTIYGGSGFVGRYVARRMAKAGWRVRVACRRPNEALFVKPYGAVGQVEPVFCNIRDDDSVASVIQGADAVVNCVGILNEVGRNKFGAVQNEGAARIARIASQQGVGQMVHISAIGADVAGESKYARSKAEGEAGVLANFPGAVILRPSVIFGTEDGFFNFFSGLARWTPVLPVVGAATKFQPVYVDDVAEVAAKAARGEVPAGVYELGGPDVATLRELLAEMFEVTYRRRLVLNMPFWMGRLMGFGFDMLQALTGGLVTNGMLTRDQVKSLKSDNVVAEDAKGFADLGIKPTAMEAVLPSYLWRFRPQGQYDAITNSAKNLKV